MKKIEVYVTDSEYIELESKVREFETCVREHQEDGVYTDEERAEIINTYGAIPLYASKGLKKKLKEMEDYISRYSNDSMLEKFITKTHNEEFTNNFVTEKKENSIKRAKNGFDSDIVLPENITYETATDDSIDFNFTDAD